VSILLYSLKRNEVYENDDIWQSRVNISSRKMLWNFIWR